MSNKKKLDEVLCVLNPDDIYNLQNYYGESSAFLATPYEIQDLKKEQWLMPLNLKEGAIITRHPYKKEYFFLNEQTEDKIALDRISLIGTILSYLGAKNFKVCQTSLQFNDKTKKYNAGVDVSVLMGDFSGEVTSSKSDKITEQFTIKNTSEWPGTYTRKGYKRAVEIAKWSGLDKDGDLSSIIEQRNPDHPNALSTRTYSIDVRSDLEQCRNTSIDLKATVKRCNINVDLNGGYNSEEKSSRHNTFDFEVEFGPLIESPSKHKWTWWIIGGVVATLAVGLLIALL